MAGKAVLTTALVGLVAGALSAEIGLVPMTVDVIPSAAARPIVAVSDEITARCDRLVGTEVAGATVESAEVVASRAGR